ncbi:MAG: hypothetical protein JW739_07745 [Opitutales bacterium]|nr:hypothetical protein [Opitutales bacterium]
MSSYGLFAGISTIDLIYEFSHYPESDTKNNAETVVMNAGGPAYNAAVLYSRLGNPTVLVSAVGAHSLTAVLKNDLAKHRVRLQDLAPDSGEMPVFASIVSTTTNAHRTVFTQKSPMNQVPLEVNRARQLVDGAAFLLADGHHLPAALLLAELAHQKGIPVILDAGSWKPGLEALLVYCTDVVASEKFRTPGAASIEESIAALRAYPGIQRIAATRGARSTLWWQSSQTGEVAIPAVAAIDTLGAGDFFHGAYAHALQQGFTFTDALGFSAHLASASTTTMGTRDWLETLPQLLQRCDQEINATSQSLN